MGKKQQLEGRIDLPLPPPIPEDVAPPRFSIVIPTFNCALTIAWTLDSIKSEHYPNLEVIVVDAGSTDRTLEVVQRTFRGKLRLYTIAEQNPFEMYNRGISLATGDYVGMLYPGDAYLSQEVLHWIGATAVEHDMPDLVYCGAMRHDVGRDPELLLEDLSIDLLRRVIQPTSIQGAFFRLDTLRAIGKFNPAYRIRGGLDLFCRFALQEDLRVACLRRVLVDHDRPFQMPGRLLRRALETHRILHQHFGLGASLRWWVKQDHWSFIRWWMKNKRTHLFS